MRSTAECPLSISLVFKYCKGDTVLHTGSVGIGFTINRKVTVSAGFSSENLLFMNGKKITMPTVSYAVSQLTDKHLTLNITSPLPLACGFGVSGASTLAALYAVNKLINSGKSDEILHEIAHISEIINHTGLGTIGTQITGGFLIKSKPGLPVVATTLPFTGKRIYAIIMGKIETPSMLSDKRFLAKVERFYPVLSGDENMEKIIDISYGFVKKTGIVPIDVDREISKIRKKGGHATMLIFGRVVISDSNPGKSGYLVEELTVSKDMPKIF